jgi:hypothetical protein
MWCVIYSFFLSVDDWNICFRQGEFACVIRKRAPIAGEKSLAIFFVTPHGFFVPTATGWFRNEAEAASMLTPFFCVHCILCIGSDVSIEH